MCRNHGRTFRARIAAFVFLAACAAPAYAQVDVEAFSGAPFGVGRLSVTMPAGRELFPLVDDRFILLEKDGRALYSVSEMAPVRRALRRFLGVEGTRRTNVYFLFKGNEPLQLTLHTPDPIKIDVRPKRDEQAWQGLLDMWWREYTGDLRRLGRSSEYPLLVENYLTPTLARRLNLPMPAERRLFTRRADVDEAVGMMLGTESVRIAMQKKTLLGDTDPSEPANQPLPTPIAPPALDFPELLDEVAIEPIADHVPVECFYVRFGNFANYLWLRDFLELWGGDIRTMVAVRGLDYQINERLERQLALRESALARVLGPNVIADVAMIGNDTFVREGAAVGILFQARSNQALAANIVAQRQAALKREPGSREEMVKIAGRDVSFLSTPDNRVRSFYAVDGDYHLVTTSRTVARRFYEAGAGSDSLGSSHEFRYARSVMPLDRDDTVLVYLSDPFIRQFVSPHYRVEMTRRMQSTSEIDLLRMARLAARAEGLDARSIDELVDAELLPEHFGRRPDGSRLVVDGERIVDSMRGAQGYFLPLCDLDIDGVTPSEARAYEGFAEMYRSEWEAMDPMIAGIRREQLNKEGLERMKLDVHITPYAKRHYGWMTAMLGPPTRKSLAPVRGDLVSLELVTSGAGVPFVAVPFAGAHLFAGLRDTALPLVVDNGTVRPGGPISDMLRGYLGAWPRPGLLTMLLGDNNAAPDEEGFAPLHDERGWQRKMQEFLVLSFQRDVLQEVTPQLEMVENERPAQARLRIADLSGTQLAEGLTTLGYVRAAQASASGTRLMNNLADQLHVPREECQQVAEELLDARLVCPLGGKYSLVEHAGGLKTWSSTATPSENQVLLTTVPEDYEFPLFAWFRGLEAELSLTDVVLSAHAEIDMQLKPQAAGFQWPLFTKPPAKKSYDLPPPDAEQPPPLPEQE